MILNVGIKRSVFRDHSVPCTSCLVTVCHSGSCTSQGHRGPCCLGCRLCLFFSSALLFQIFVEFSHPFLSPGPVFERLYFFNDFTIILVGLLKEEEISACGQVAVLTQTSWLLLCSCACLSCFSSSVCSFLLPLPHASRQRAEAYSPGKTPASYAF